MSLWWRRKDELDHDQLKLIDGLPLRDSYLVVGPPGCGKTNVLLRRAQFVRSQNLPNIMVLTFTRALAEFVKTGCFDEQGQEIFPMSCVSTIESWLRSLYVHHDKSLPDRPDNLNLIEWKKRLAKEAMTFADCKRLPKYDVLFIDEAQDLLKEEISVIGAFSNYQFFVGDDRQKIYMGTAGLCSIRVNLPHQNMHRLRFHYRLAPEICKVADRILISDSESTLESTCHYNGPEPASVIFHTPPLTKEEQITTAIKRLKQQIRVYADFIEQGDRIGVLVARRRQREEIYERLDEEPDLKNKVQIVRSRSERESKFDPILNPQCSVYILTLKGCKGLEFRTVHWLFADDLSYRYRNEDFYTGITRAKTSVHVYFTSSLPPVLARAHAPNEVLDW